MNKFYLTTPIYYPNARPHVGSAYTTIVCDVMARYKRMCGYDVAFLTGTDEHGEKLQRAGEAAGKSPAQFVAEKRELFKDLWRKLGIGEFRDLSVPDGDVAAGSSRQEEDGGVKPPLPPIKRLFVHTSQNPAHVESVHWMIRQAKKAGYIEKKKYEGRYCVFDERYVSDNPEAVNCDICGRPAELISEENYFFKLSAFQERLRKLYDEHPEFVLPDFRMNEVKSFVKSGLRDISISRKRLKWGIPWPGDPEQVVYVWYDALTSYLTGIGFRGEERSKDFEKYWMDTDAEVVHMIGKDIIRFHAVYWPAFLMAARLPLPKTIFAHGWIYYEQDKMSKSKGNVVYPEPIVEALDSFGAPGNDALRYYLLREATFGQDMSFSYDGLIQRFNSDLANGLGNLANRTIVMLDRYFDAVIPSPDNGWSPREETLKATAENEKVLYLRGFGAHEFSRGLDAVWDLISETNKYLVVNQPWAISPEIAEREGEPIAVSVTPPRTGVHDATDSVSKRARLATILYAATEVVRTASVLLYPVIPKSAERIWKQLGCEGSLKDQNPNDLKWGALKPGTKVGKAEIIFPRLDMDAAIEKLLELEAGEQAVAPVYDRRGRRSQSGATEEVFDRRNVEESAKKGTTTVEHQPKQKSVPEKTTAPSPESRIPSPEPRIPAPASPGAPSPHPKITIEDFAKVEMRVGEVVAAERIPKADKLLKLQVDIGTEIRQVVAGIAEYYEPEKLIGMKVIVVTNLQPRKLRGVESDGMIVAASVGEEGRPVLVTFTEDVPKGARLK